jgi:hypothetical protein
LWSPDERRVRSLENSAATYEAALSGHLERFDAVSESVIIHNLTAADFLVLDDGRPQKIDNVSFEKRRYWDVRDDKGHHLEYIGIGGGKWSTGEWRPEVAAVSQLSQYVISYPVPDSPEGRCHKIRIKVNRRYALVSFRGEYCNTHHPASDPLNGIKTRPTVGSRAGGACRNFSSGSSVLCKARRRSRPCRRGLA